MSITKHIVPFAGCCAVVLAACSSGDKVVTDSAAGTTPAPAPTATISLAQVAGKWNMRAVPETGSDTTPTLLVLTATADTTGWTMTFPNRPPTRVRVTVSGDSIVTESEPYESVRRKGVNVTTRGVMRMQGDSLVGTTTARYATTGADSVMRFRSTAKRAP